MGIVPRPIPPPLKTLREGQIPVKQSFRSYYFEGQMGYQPPSRVRVWNEYDSFAARISAPIWLFVWLMTWGKMGKGLWKVEIVTRKWTPPFVDAKSVRETALANAKAALVVGHTYIRDGNHVLVGERRPLADDADLRPDSMFIKDKEKA